MAKKTTIKWSIGHECKKHGGAHLYCGQNRTEFTSRLRAEEALVGLLARADVCSAIIEDDE